MSRLAIGLPLTLIQQREQHTIQLLKILREKGFTEGPYQKPDRIFKNGDNLVKINIRDGVVNHNNTRVFSGNRYHESITHLEGLIVNQKSN